MPIRFSAGLSLIALSAAALAVSACTKEPVAEAPKAAPAAETAATQASPATAADMPAGHEMAMAAPAPQAAAAPAQAAGAPTQPFKVADFTLTDANGKTHQLYKLADKKAVVLVMSGVGCPIVRKMTPDIKAAFAAYTPKSVEFLMVNANPQDSPQMIAEEAKEFEQPIPVLKDADQKLGKALGVKRTAEIFVIEPKTWNVVYHGPIDDRLSYGLEKAVASRHYLSDALDQVLAGKPVTVEQTQANGCLINFS